MSNENNMQSLNPQEQLLKEACRSYLDAVYALNVFQNIVSRTATEILNEARDRISSIAQLEEKFTWDANQHLHPQPFDQNADGLCAAIGAKIWLGKPIGGSLCLTLDFTKVPNSTTKVEVSFAIEVAQKYRLKSLEPIFKLNPKAKFYDDWDWLAVVIRNPLQDSSNIREEFKAVLDESLSWWSSHPAPTTD
jgi:hypothetical protein